MKRSWLFVTLAVFLNLPLMYAAANPPATLDESLIWTAPIDANPAPESHAFTSKTLADDLKGLWTATGAMSKPRVDHTATLLNNGKVLVVGGFYNNGVDNYLKTAELYDPATGTWTAATPMLKARIHHTATLLSSGKVLITGGQNSTNGVLAEAVTYDPATNAWASAGAMSIARVLHTDTFLPRNGTVLVIGGYKALTEAFPQKADLYDPLSTAASTWSVPTSALISGLYSHTATMLKTGKILVTGGTANTTVGAELYDPMIARTWKLATPMSVVRYGHTATLLGNGKVLVTGGYYRDSTDHYHASAELYTPYPSGPVVASNVGGCTTGPAAPAATTTAASDFTSTSAKLTGEVNDNCADTLTTFAWGPAIAYESKPVTAGAATVAGTGLKL